MTTHLVIPDVHVAPDQRSDTLELVSKFMFELRPDVIVCLGDFADMPSLCSYDRGRKSFEGRRYARDIESVHTALEVLFRDVNDYNSMRKRNKQAQYNPRTVMLMGNHENRINRAIDLDPVLEGTLDIGHLNYETFFDEVYPFLTSVEIDGVYYSHYFPSGVMGNPIQGVMPARSTLQKNMASCTSGHTHIFDYSTATSPDGSRCHGLVAGSLVDYDMAYANGVQHMWWSGVVVKRNVVNGDYDLETVSLRSLKQTYGE